MKIALLTSTNFDETNIPLIKKEIEEEGHQYKEFKDLEQPQTQFFDFDVVWDRSSIIDDVFFEKLEDMINKNEEKTLFVNSPESIMNSYDKIRTHKNMGNYSPLTQIYDGTNFEELSKSFKDDEYVVLKRPRGWKAKDIKKVFFQDLLEKDLQESTLVQKYIEPKNGINRALILQNDEDICYIAVYTRIPENNWRTGINSKSKIELITPTDSMKDFIYHVSLESGLILNGIDFISTDDEHYLLEVNSVPRLSTSVDYFGINAPKICIRNIEELTKKVF